jgi:hypothetical protein
VVTYIVVKSVRTAEESAADEAIVRINDFMVTIDNLEMRCGEEIKSRTWKREFTGFPQVTNC